MALLHKAEINPTKLELLAAWLPTCPWYDGPEAPALERVTACRFDDPAGQVGVEILIVRAGDGPLLHTPLTYRDAPLAGAEQFLVGTVEHSVLGKRWVYDACGDPVYVAALAQAILTGSGEAEELVDDGGRLVPRTPAMTVRGTGTGSTVPEIAEVSVTEVDPTLVSAGSLELAVARVLGPAAASGERPELRGSWSGVAGPVTLAWLR